MKKNLIVIALVLLIAMGGLFADVDLPDEVKATLVGTVGEYLEHGFDDENGEQYQTGVQFSNALDSAGVTLIYRYKINYDTAVQIGMSISDFMHTDNVASIPIGSVVRGDDAPFTTWTSGDFANYYKMGEMTGPGTTSGKVTFTVTAGEFDEAEQKPGKYTSNISVVVFTE
jgi:hypothetical protein